MIPALISIQSTSAVWTLAARYHHALVSARGVARISSRGVPHPSRILSPKITRGGGVAGCLGGGCFANKQFLNMHFQMSFRDIFQKY